MTSEESKIINSLQNQVNKLGEVYYRTHSIDQDNFQNPVFFNNTVQFPYRKIYQRSLVTTTATTTPIFQSTLGLYGDGLYQVMAVINGKKGTADYGAYTLKAVIKFVFGAPTILASTITTEYESDATWDVTLTTSGNNYLINVVSSTGTILWTSTIEEYK